MKRVAAIVALLLLAIAGGCDQTRECRALTLLVTLRFDGAAAGADAIEVDVSTNGAPTKVNPFVRTVGDATGTVELWFPSGYQSGATVAIAVRATAGGALVGLGTGSAVLPDTCGVAEIAIEPATQDDAGATD